MQRDDIQSLTGLRGIAAWWVVIYHLRDPIAPYVGSFIYSVIEHGYLAVDLFFILSGFVIYLNYSKDFEVLTGDNLRKFSIKRFARIYPLHISMLLIFLLNPLAIYLFSKAASYDGRYELSYYILSIFLIQNWGFTHELMWNIPAWSISTEMAAYIGFPFMCWIINKFKLHTALAGLVLFVLAIICIALTFFALDCLSLEGDIPKIGLIRCLLEFSLGMILCRIYRDHYSAVIRNTWLFIGGFGFMMIMGYAENLPDYTFIPIAYSLLLLGVVNTRTLPSRLFGSTLIVYLGNISYSTYLVHYFVKDWVKFLSVNVGITQFLIYIVITLLSSVLLYRMIENPGRRVITWLALR